MRINDPFTSFINRMVIDSNKLNKFTQNVIN